MAKYKLTLCRQCIYQQDDNVLIESKKEYKTDEAAWNGLRQKFHHNAVFGGGECHAMLWKKVKIDIPVNDEEKYMPIYEMDKDDIYKVTKPEMDIWIPVLAGYTSHPYKHSGKINLDI